MISSDQFAILECSLNGQTNQNTTDLHKFYVEEIMESFIIGCATDKSEFHHTLTSSMSQWHIHVKIKSGKKY